MFLLLLLSCTLSSASRIILYSATEDNFATRELGRYIYLVSGEYPTLIQGDASSFNVTSDVETILIGAPRSELILAAAGDVIASSFSTSDSTTLNKTGGRHSVTRTSPFVVAIVGETPKARLYGVYTAAEQLGVRFELHQDVVPDPTADGGLPLREVAILPFIDVPPAAPTFDYRGLQPFHDFLEGPDGWDVGQYKHVIAQISKMKMNFIGLHTYPYSPVGGGFTTGYNEPTVWVGTTKELNDDGTVKQGYPTSYANSMRGEWAESEMRTSEYHFGTSELFEDDCWPNFSGDSNTCPYPTTVAGSNKLFEATSSMLESAFQFGTQLFVDSCIGTETPLSKPNVTTPSVTTSSVSSPLSPSPSTKDYYEGIFTRLTKVLPSLDWYWIWTPEKWEWSQVNASNPIFTNALDDLAAAMEARKNVVGFQNIKMATNGWVVGPLPDRTVFDNRLPPEWDAITSIDLNTGHAPVDPSYANITNHKKWVIPWMEDDPTLTQPQLWVNRTLMHMEDASKYGASGLLGIHWRTRATSPQISAMAQKSWLSNLTSSIFWSDWVSNQFGLKVNTKDHDCVTKIFEQDLDSTNMPIVTQWGPGALAIGCKRNKTKLQFFAKLMACDANVTGAANQDRFSYWKSQFAALLSMASTDCAIKEWNDVVATIKNATTTSERTMLANKIGLPSRIHLVNNVTEMMTHVQDTISSPGEIGTYMNLESQSLKGPLNATELLGWLGVKELPEQAKVPLTRTKNTRLIVPTARTTATVGEQVSWRALVLQGSECVLDPATGVLFLFRRIGDTSASWSNLVMTHIGRSVWEVSGSDAHGSNLPGTDIEYYVKLQGCGGSVVFPAGAPTVVQTLVWAW